MAADSPSVSLLNSTLLESLTLTLRGVLGDSPARALLYHLNFSPSNDTAATLATRMHQVLGDGAIIIERMMVKSLYENYGLHFEEGEFDFVRSIERLSAAFGHQKGWRSQ